MCRRARAFKGKPPAARLVVQRHPANLISPCTFFHTATPKAPQIRADAAASDSSFDAAGTVAVWMY